MKLFFFILGYIIIIIIIIIITSTSDIQPSTLISDQSPSELAFNHIEDTFYMYYNSAQSINNCFILNAYERK